MNLNNRWYTSDCRKGYLYLNYIDLGEECWDSCEQCGTTIRYVHYVQCPETFEVKAVGGICADHLCQALDEAAGARREYQKEWKEFKKSFTLFSNVNWVISHAYDIGLDWVPYEGWQITFIRDTTDFVVPQKFLTARKAIQYAYKLYKMSGIYEKAEINKQPSQQ